MSKQPMTNDETTSDGRLIRLGHIGDAHGLKGEVVIKSETTDPLAIGRYGALTDKAGIRSFKLSGLRVAGKGVIGRIDGIADRTAAEALRGTELFCRRQQLPSSPPQNDEWYVVDLIGSVVEAIGNLDGLVGRVVDVANYGAGDLLEIKFDGHTETVLLPFTKACVPEIDLANGRIGIVVPEGLIDNGDGPEDGDAPAEGRSDD